MKHLRSWIIWGLWAVFGLAWELWCVFQEKRTGDEPLTRIVRDRLARKNVVARLALLLGIAWLGLHFLTPLNW